MGNGLGGMLKGIAETISKEAAERVGDAAADALKNQNGGMLPEEVMAQFVTNENYVRDMHEQGLKDPRDWDFSTLNRPGIAGGSNS
jgi:hypothetical protein